MISIEYEPSINWQHITGKINGPPNSIYSGGVFNFEIKISQSYPFYAPQVYFLTKIHHPFIIESGRVKSMYLEQWSPSILIKFIIDQLAILLDINE